MTRLPQDDAGLEESIERLRRLLPAPEALWDGFLTTVRPWAIPVGSEDGRLVLQTTGEHHLVRVGFEREEWRDYLAARIARAAPLDQTRAVHVDWQGVEDDLQDAVDAGYPWIGIRGYRLVGLTSPDGEPWAEIAEPEQDDTASGGHWTVIDTPPDGHNCA